MSKTSSDLLLERLSAWGIKRIFGYPGDGTNGILGAASEKFEFVQVRHEETAAFMACAHAKFTNEVGVCLATSGPGAIHLLNGLYDAKTDHQPVIAIVCQLSNRALGGHYQQEVDLINLFKDVAGEYVHMASNTTQIRHLIDRTVRIAKAERTVTCIIVPNDIELMEAVEAPPRKYGTIHTEIGYTANTFIPEQDDLQAAAEILNQGKKIAILVGTGALTASDEVMQVAEILGAGVAKTLLGKAVLPDDLPYVTGTIGLLGTEPSRDLMNDCDTLLVIGSSFPYSEFLPKEDQARGVQIDIDGKMLSLHYPMSMNLLGDSKATLQALIPFLKPKLNNSWQKEIEEKVKKWWRLREMRALSNPINPQRVIWELSMQITGDAIVTVDSGSVVNWYARDLKIKKGMKASLSGSLTTMGPAVPYAIAAKFAYPNRPVIALVGDGAMQMNGINEMITIAKYWKKWENPSLIIMVLKNKDLNLVTSEQRILSGDPRTEQTHEIPDFRYADYAKLIGLEGMRVENSDDIENAWKIAFSSQKPFVLEICHVFDLIKSISNIPAPTHTAISATLKTGQ